MAEHELNDSDINAIRKQPASSLVPETVADVKWFTNSNAPTAIAYGRHP